MSKKFKYDVIQVIEAIKERSCIWDKRLEAYKDRLERRLAWEEIFVSVDPTYDYMTPEEKRITGELIMNKWTNIRDTFIKTLKPHLGKPKKKYLYHKYLKFLMEILPEDEYNVIEFKECSNDNDALVTQNNDSGSETEDFNTTKKKRKIYSVKKESKKYKSEDEDEIEDSHEYNLDDASENELDLTRCSEATSSVPRLMNEDEAFFASLLPTVVKYSEDERLEFRIDVLNAMKKIKEKRQGY